MKHEFKIGELVRPHRDLGGRAVHGGESGGLGFIYKITPRHVYVMYASGTDDVFLLSSFNNYFERATKTK